MAAAEGGRGREGTKPVGGGWGGIKKKNPRFVDKKV